MILLSLGLLAFAVADLVRWHPERVGAGRKVSGAIAGAGVVTAVAALSDAAPWPPAALGGAALVVLALWVSLDDLPVGPAAGLLIVAGVLVALFGLSGSADQIGGSLADWYAGLGFPFVAEVSVDQFTLAIAVALFLLATTNRIVRLVLDAALPQWKSGEDALKGGRVLGPLERLIVGAIVLTGDPAAAAIVIAAKSLLRFPEMRKGEDGPGPEAVTEYFLIGTLSSLLIAALLAILVLSAG